MEFFSEDLYYYATNFGRVVLHCFDCPGIITESSDISLVVVMIVGICDVLQSCLVHCPRSGTAPLEDSSTPSNTVIMYGASSREEASLSVGAMMGQSGELHVIMSLC